MHAIPLDNLQLLIDFEWRAFQAAPLIQKVGTSAWLGAGRVSFRLVEVRVVQATEMTDEPFQQFEPGAPRSRDRMSPPPELVLLGRVLFFWGDLPPQKKTSRHRFFL